MISQVSAQPICPRCAQLLTADAHACGSCGALLLAYTPLQPGQAIDGGRYTIRRILSNSGTIALAIDHLTFDRAVVIKAILDGFDPSDPSQLQASRARFLQETQTLATLQHPAIPHLFGSFRDGPHNYIVVEYVEGEDLTRRLTRIDSATGARVSGQPYDRQDVLCWGVALCQALEYLAGRQPQPVLHQDIKPANLVIDSSSGSVRLVDFGASRARPVATNGAAVRRLVLMGTHGYAAPEQYTGQAEPCSDVYALAATLYHLATDDDPREHPFEFPHLARLGLLGQALDAALQLDVAARLTAVDLRRRLEGIVGATHVQPIQTPDGIELRDVTALADWCERHWSQAGPWLAGALPEQIERLWGKFRLAQQLRDLQQQHRGDQHTLLDAALALMDPTGFGMARPQLAYAWPAIDFGPRAADELATYSMLLTNPGRRTARAQIHCPSWISASRSHVILAPRQSVGVTFYANLRGVATFGQLRDDIVFRDGATTLLTVEARTTVSRWRTLWRRYPGRIIAAIPRGESKRKHNSTWIYLLLRNISITNRPKLMAYFLLPSAHYLVSASPPPALAPPAPPAGRTPLLR